MKWTWFKVQEFCFYKDPMPDWFTDKVTTNEVVLRNCNYSFYDIEEAFCEIKTPDGIIIARGGDIIRKGEILTVLDGD